MRGRNINLTVTAGVESTRVVKPVGEGWGFVNVSGRGWLFDVKGEEVVAEMVVEMRGDGAMEVVFPAMGEGRYGFIVDVRNDAGEVTRVLDGYVGYDGPDVVDEGLKEEEEPTILVYMDGEQRRAVMAPTSAAQRYAEEAREAMVAVGDIDKKLELAEQLEASFSGKMSNFVIPSEETGTWWVGGENTQLPWRGVDGIDGAKVKRIEVDSEEQLPETGETCNGGYYYYVTNAESAATLEAGETIYVYVGGADVEGLQINDYTLETAGMLSVWEWVDKINTDFVGVLEASIVTEKRIKLENIGSTPVRLSAHGTVWADLYLQRECGYAVFAWVERLGVGRWVRVGVTQEESALVEATTGSLGGVMLTNTLLGSSYDYVLPTKQAIRAYIDSSVNECAKKSELENLVSKEELQAEGFLKPDDVAGYVTEGQVDSKLDDRLSGVALKSGFVVMSETEYNLLPEPAAGVFYFTYAD